MLSRSEYDVITIGGGPGGAAAATLIAQRGWSTLLLERSAEPQFKIGESLMPATYWTFERLGHAPQARRRATSRGSTACSSSPRPGRASMPFYFQETDPHESSVTWQVLRSEFDAMLLDNAAEHGVEVRARRGRQGGAVRRRAGGRRQGGAAGRRGARDRAARVVVDATGQSAMITRSLGLRKADRELRKAAVFTHFEGALRDPGIDEGATLVLRTEQRGGLVLVHPAAGEPGERRRGRRARLPDHRPAATTRSACSRRRSRNARPLGPRIADARQVFPVQVRREFSYRSTRIAGDGWVTGGRRVRLPRPDLLLGRAAGPQVGRAGGRLDRRGAQGRRRLGRAAGRPRPAASLPAWRRCASSSTPSTRRTSASRKFLCRFPEQRHRAHPPAGRQRRQGLRPRSSTPCGRSADCPRPSRW